MCNTNTIIDKADILGIAYGDTENNMQQYSFKMTATGLADTSLFNVKEHVVASVWVLERRHIRQTMEDNQNNFVMLFVKQHW